MSSAAADPYSSQETSSASSLKHWKCEFWFDEAHEKDHHPQKVNLCEKLNPGLKLPGYPHKTRYRFPLRFKGSSSLEALVVELKVAAIASGFSLVVRKTVRLPTKNRSIAITLQCDKARMCQYRSFKKKVSDQNEDPETVSTKRKNKSMTKSNLSSKDESCSFTVAVFLSPVDDYWYLSTATAAKESTCCDHDHHMKLDPSQLHVPLNCLSPEERKLAAKCCQLRFSSAMAAALATVQQKHSQDAQHAEKRNEMSYNELSAEMQDVWKLIENGGDEGVRQYNCLMTYLRTTKTALIQAAHRRNGGDPTTAPTNSAGTGVSRNRTNGKKRASYEIA